MAKSNKCRASDLGTMAGFLRGKDNKELCQACLKINVAARNCISLLRNKKRT